ncbi:MAG: NAD-dependent epimerase/dehydratase family protein [Asgard group archaeon]|nr:NAD-dependent epimerase/dehydratase family protein [Asgard group archaeon]
MSNTQKDIDVDFQKCLVVGGSGMLGYEIVRQLLKRKKDVRVLDITPLPEANGVEFIKGDIRNKAVVKKAVREMDVVFQTAAAVWDPTKPKSIYEEVNIAGNKNVIDACLEAGVPKMVYTSTMDVVVDGKKPIINGDESLPYPENLPKDPYSQTKIIGEKTALAANSSDFSTCALRPVGMYGPRDKYHVANFIKLAKNNSDIRLGRGKAKFSHVYSENAAYAHILAAEHLYPNSPVCGEKYFITDHPASNLFDFMDPFLEELNLPTPTKCLPYRLAYILAFFAEKIAPKSNFNRFSVIQTCIDHTFIHDKAREDFGYEPIVSKEEAFKKTIKWWKANEDFLID